MTRTLMHGFLPVVLSCPASVDGLIFKSPRGPLVRSIDATHLFHLVNFVGLPQWLPQ